MISIPFSPIDEPIGPIQNGITYIVLPSMHPSKSLWSIPFISAGAFQWLVGTASSSLSEQMKVRDSTRAASRLSDLNKEHLDRFC